MIANSKVRIHPSAEIDTETEIGEGSQIWHQAQIREGARIGKNCILGKGSYVDVNVSIGDNCKVQNGVYIYRGAQIESGVFVGANAVITNDKIPRAVNPDMSLREIDEVKFAPVTIKQGASVGAGAVILPGVTIGSWAMVGAGCVVTENVLPHALMVGNPARLVGYVCSCGGRLESMANSAKRHKCVRCKHQIFLIDALID